MTHTHSTKRALISSVLAMILCIAMLVGTTFAWFTDTASTGVNKIVAGNLHVDLQMKDNNGNWVSAKGKTLQFKVNGQIPAEGTQILWEPGATYELPELRVVNTGNLALKYKIEITGITGDAELNNVIDWTMTVDGADYALGVEHHLAAKVGDAEDADQVTIKGQMQTDAGNYYMDKEIDGVSITVYAVQDTVESDSNGNQYDAKADGTPDGGFDWTANVAASGTVTAGQETVLKDRESDPTVTATIPANSTSTGSLTLTKAAGTTPANIEVVSGTSSTTANISLTDGNGNAVTAKSGKFFTLTMQLEKNLNVIGFYHNSEPMTKAASAEAVSETNDTYYYDAATGVLTFSTDDFSPFTVVTSESAFNGGKGTAADPYLIATAEQALAVENSKGYFKQVNDIVVPDEVYMGSKTYVWDLNGHTIRLEYGDGITLTNGGVFNVGGKNSSLTINDSSADQSGAVIGSDQTYKEKVTSAVRINYQGKLTINGGHFYGMSEGTSCIFTAGRNATVIINGGVFETASPYGDGIYYVLNHQDGKAGASWNNKTGGSKMTVYGGTFKEYNPGVTEVDPVNSGTGKISVADGYKTTSEVIDGATWYTVVSK